MNEQKKTDFIRKRSNVISVENQIVKSLQDIASTVEIS